MAVTSQRLWVREPNADPLIAKLEAVQWAMRELGRYTIPAPEVLVPVTDPAHILVLHDC